MTAVSTDMSVDTGGQGGSPARDLPGCPDPGCRLTVSVDTYAQSRRGWAYVGVAVGGAVSVAANVAHSYVPPQGATAGWEPEPGAVFGAVFWPVALFVAIEILARTDWPAGARWVWLRFGGLVPVAAVAAVVSYRHLSGLLAWYHEDVVTARLGPLAVDGLMVMATGALIAACGRDREPVVSRPDEPPQSAGVSPPGEHPLEHSGLALVSTPAGPQDEPPDEPPAEVAREHPGEPPDPPLGGAHQRRVSPAGGGSRRGKVTASALACDCGCGQLVSRATRTRHRAARRSDLDT